MNKLRKGVLLLSVAVAGLVGTASTAGAATTTNTTSITVTVKNPNPVPNSFGSVWM